MLQAVAVYLLKTIIVSAVLVLYYWVALRNKRFHYYNRFYLLCAVVLSITLPFLNLNLFTFSSHSDKAISMFNVIYADGETELLLTGGSSFDWQQLIFLLALTITTLLLVRLLFSILKIYRVKKKYPVSDMQEFDFINTDLQQAPFSFLKNIFWRNDISLEERTGRLILQHELAHIRQKHTLDKLFMQIVVAVLWVNPLYRLIQKELYLIHEFIADDKSVTDSDTAAFAEMLLHTHYGKFNFDPAQPFFYSPIKRRLIMLTTSKEPRFSYVRRMMALPLLACTVLLFAFRLQKENNETVTTLKHGTTFKLVVDAGHGGTDNGAIGINNQKEKDINLAISKKIKELSAEYGIDVILTREKDILMTPPQKVDFSSAQHADAFISIHSNAADAKYKGQKSGIEIFVSPDNSHLNESKLLGSAVLQNLNNSFKVNTPLFMSNVGIWVLKSNPDPAILIECGYLDNKEDVKTMTDAVQVETMARKILEGVAAYANHKTINSYDVQLQEAVSFKDTTTPAAAAPLYILDGKEIDAAIMKVLDPNKIETINVLKDKTAIDKYGEKGKNGVVEIKTKAFQDNSTLIIKKEGADAVLYIIDGKATDKPLAEKIKPEDIKSINVLKNEAATTVYGDRGKNGVIIITTKNYNPKSTVVLKGGPDAPLYVLDGNFISAEELQLSISPDDILSMNVLKADAAVKAYGDKGKNGVIEITSKNKNGSATKDSLDVKDKKDK